MKKVLVINIFKNYKKKVLKKEYVELIKQQNKKDLLFAKKIITEKILWVVSWIPFLIIWFLLYIIGLIKIDLSTIITFVISHMIYWVFSGKKATRKFIDDVVPELEMVIDVLLEIKEERLKI